MDETAIIIGIDFGTTVGFNPPSEVTSSADSLPSHNSTLAFPGHLPALNALMLSMTGAPGMALSATRTKCPVQSPTMPMVELPIGATWWMK